MGAGRVISVDNQEYRLEKARQFAGSETINFDEVDDIVKEIIRGNGRARRGRLHRRGRLRGQRFADAEVHGRAS